MSFVFTDDYLRSCLIDLCGFSSKQAEIIMLNHKDQAREIIFGLSLYAEQVNFLKFFYKSYE